MITFYYFKGCPNAEKTWDNLIETLKKDEIPESELKKIEVPDLKTAEEEHFQGSPTILIEGIDIYTGQKPEGFHYTCRIYQFGEKRTGILSKNFIREKIQELYKG